MPRKQNTPAGPPADKGRPTPREAVARAQAAAGPAVARAQAKAGPKVEQAATKAGSLLGTLRDRAKETAKGFTEGYGKSADDTDDTDDKAPESTQVQPPAPDSSPVATDAEKPRPRPRPQRP